MRTHLRAVLIFLLTALLLAFFFRNADLGGVWTEVRNADGWLLLGATAITMATYLIRGLRWQVLLRPLGRVHFVPAVKATVIGFAASVILPARAGEFLRPYLLARRERLSATSAFATVVLERVLDLVNVLLLLGLYLLLMDPARASLDPPVLAAVRAGGAAAALASVGGLVMLGVLAGHPEWLFRAVGRLERLLPGAAGRLKPVAGRFAQGLVTIRQPRRLLIILALSLPIWLMIAAGIWLTALAFHMRVPYIGSFLIVAILVVGVAVPTPGAIGGFHAAFQVATTSFYGASVDSAVGAAIVLHALSFLPVVLLGALFMVHDGLSFGRVRALADGAGLSEEASHDAARLDPAADAAVGEAEGLR